MSSQSTAVAPLTETVRCRLPCLSSPKMRAESPLSLCVHSVPVGDSTSPDSSVATGAVTRPTSFTVALRHNAGGWAATRVAVGRGDAAGGAEPCPPQPTAKSTTATLVALQPRLTRGALVAGGRGGEAAAGALRDEL